jgi:hypothetical protein
MLGKIATHLDSAFLDITLHQIAWRGMAQHGTGIWIIQSRTEWLYERHEIGRHKTRASFVSFNLSEW